MKHHALTLAITIAGLLGSAASAQQNSANRMTQEADSSFATKAAQGGIAEVELGKLATEHASNDSVKRFAEQMVDDHTKANDELKTLAAGKGMNLPTTMDS
jgi:putative membrane protein